MPEKKEKSKYAYRPQYGLVIICESEKEQIERFNDLQKKGYKLKVVTV